MDICCLSIAVSLQALYRKRQLYACYLDTRSKLGSSVSARKSVACLSISGDFCLGKYFYFCAQNEQKANIYIYKTPNDQQQGPTRYSEPPMKISFRIHADISKEYSYYSVRVL